MSRGYYASTRATSLSSGVTSGAVDLPVTDGTTFPDPDAPGNMEYTIIVGYGSDREEVCTVTAKPTADTLRVTRGEDGTSATAKNIGDVVVHGVSARDFTEPRIPAAHAATHASAGTDPVTVAQSQVTGLTAALAAIGSFGNWTPTLAQAPDAPNIAKTVHYGRYTKLPGGLVMANCLLQPTASGGEAGGVITLTLPAVPLAPSDKFVTGAGFGVYTRPGATDQFACELTGGVLSLNFLGVTEPLIASGHLISLGVLFEAAP